MLRDLMSEGSLADLTVAYFADNDYRSHKVGPHAALDVIGRVDQMLAEAFDAGGGLDEVLRDTYVIITSDHGHCEVLADAARSEIHLDALLANFRQAELARAWKKADEIMICPNMRAAQIYLQRPRPDIARRIVDDLLKDPRVDMALWRSSLIEPGATGYTVAGRRGVLSFERSTGGHAAGSVADDAGTPWSWRGEPATLDLETSDGRVRFNLHPNAFERIAGVLDLDKAGEIWVTATPGCEFQVPGGDAHVGGASHGALHALDSYSPVVVAGPSRVSLPRHMRSVDVAPLCMEWLGIDMRYKVGDPR